MIKKIRGGAGGFTNLGGVTHLMTGESRESVLSGRVADYLRLCAVGSRTP